MRETYLYPYSAEEACRRGEQSLWRASYLEDIDCKDAIQKPYDSTTTATIWTRNA